MSARVGVKGEPKMPPICRAIRQAREDAGLSQAEVADAMRVVQSRVSGWEASTEPRLEVLKKLDTALGLPMGTLLRRAGYIGDVIPVTWAIDEDPWLDDRAKMVLNATYRALQQESEKKATKNDRAKASR